jgi:hypothetical protein
METPAGCIDSLRKADIALRRPRFHFRKPLKDPTMIEKTASLH